MVNDHDPPVIITEGGSQTEEGYFPGLVGLDEKGPKGLWFGKASKTFWQGIQQLKKEKQGIAQLVFSLGGEILI